MAYTVALTGATGFIGSVLRRHLTRAGVPLRALSRRRDGFEDGTEWVRGTLEDEDALARLVAGADAVIHCAGAVRGAAPGHFEQVNVDGSLRLIEAARNGGHCERFLLLSSLAARHPHLSWYARSKFEAERRVGQAAGEIAVTVFRPTAVYGPGDREMRPIFEWLLRGWLFTPGQDGARLSLLHVEDLACAVWKWLESPQAPAATYELNDCQPDGYDWNSIAAIAAEIRGSPVRRIRVPMPLLKGFAQANLLVSRLSGRAPMLTPAKVGELTHPDWSCSNEAVRQALGWEPRIVLQNALREHWF
ncbi:NAD-dependent epimerase/dehydratase family protein [Azotobacter vinelandii]|uniref:NAD-dependent epimerase/dehydratase family protein n=1 Tax=Azotobacter vinelandii TaxID=354 RepID=UPI0026668D01|nr:NAD-dependent epimerase/dehydratase family protein [Azotobacter vinelandii]WKN21308.1 NAD-dependent epimerase/dehydratase family protein [Azotobacter vinelandii]